jgi:type IX secretion system PorP/SprF family membrane protein
LKKLILHIIILSSITLTSAAQDIHFSQIMESSLLRNPALAGLYKGDVRVQTVQRNQWNSVTIPYVTTSLNAEFKLMASQYTDDYVTFGIQGLYDKAGTTNFKSTHVLPVINYHKSLSAEKNRYLNVAFMGGFVNRNIDRSKITTNNQWGSGGYDASLPSGETFVTSGYKYWDISSGISYNSNIGENEDNTYYLGVAVHHINNPKVGFYENTKAELGRKFVVNGGLKYFFAEDSYLTIQGDYSKQLSHTEIIGGITYSKKLLNSINDNKYAIHFGSLLRWKDAIIPFAKLDIANMSIALSYDVNTSTLKSSSRGSGGFEISLSYTAFKEHNSSQEAVRCPKF